MIRAYLDNASTSRMDPRVHAAMAPYLDGVYGNPSSLHAAGREARRAIEDARDRVADALGADPKEVIFTSGATEADNLAVTGIARASRGRHLIVSAVEHAAVIEPACRWAEREGFELSLAPVDAQGRVDVEALERLIRDDTVLISVMTANNEVGTVQPVEEVERIARARGVPFHTDAAQSCGKVPLKTRADAVTLSAHKMNGPKGVGALVLRRGTPLEPQLWGGGHEFEKRAGTENVAAVVGLAAALDLPPAPEVAGRRDRLEARLRAEIPKIRFNGDPEHRLPTIVNLSIEGVDGEALVMALDTAGVCAATGSACASGATEPSHVLTAMGLDRRQASGSVRLSLGRTTTDEEIEVAADEMRRAVERLRSISAVWHE